VGDYKSIMTGGWFQTDGAVPNTFEVGTDGWWNAAGPAVIVVAFAGVTMDLAVMHNMGLYTGGVR